jgi:hypothetical protein
MADTQSQGSPLGTTVMALPNPMSEACSRFLTEHWELASFLLYMMLLAFDKDISERRTANILLEQGGVLDKDKPEVTHRARHGVGAVQALMTREQMLLQILLCRGVDNYLIYLADLLGLVFSSRPETLRTDDKISYQDILQFKSMDDLVNFLAERKVHSLAYKGMRDLAGYLSNKLGFEICEQSEALERIVLVIELRNLISHNRAVINRIFKERQPKFPGEIGQVIRLNMPRTLQDLDLLAASVCDIEERAAKKWKFARPIASQAHDDRLKGLHGAMDEFEAAVQGNRRGPEGQAKDIPPS